MQSFFLPSIAVLVFSLAAPILQLSASSFAS